MSVFLTNLEDFIAPSQACVVIANDPSSSSSRTGPSQKIVLDLASEDYKVEEKFNIIKPTAAKVAKVTLNDCLACR